MFKKQSVRFWGLAGPAGLLMSAVACSTPPPGCATNTTPGSGASRAADSPRRHTRGAAAVALR